MEAGVDGALAGETAWYGTLSPKQTVADAVGMCAEQWLSEFLSPGKSRRTPCSLSLVVLRERLALATSYDE